MLYLFTPIKNGFRNHWKRPCLRRLQAALLESGFCSTRHTIFTLAICLILIRPTKRSSENERFSARRSEMQRWRTFDPNLQLLQVATLKGIDDAYLSAVEIINSFPWTSGGISLFGKYGGTGSNVGCRFGL